MISGSVIWKYLTSFLKRDWTLADYPIRIRHFKIDPTQDHGHLQPVAVEAQIVNWWQMSGGGNTEAEARRDLADRFNARRESGAVFPRPGTGLPIEFAPSYRIEEHPRLAADFLKTILDLDYDECFISDDSSLWDFHADHDNTQLYEKILLTYGVDVSDIEGARLCDIFERLVSRGVSV